MKQGSFKISPGTLAGQYQRNVTKGIKDQIVKRIMTRQAAVFTSKPDVKKLIAKRLGWVDSATLMSKRVTAIEKFGQGVLKSGIKHVVLIGMGGSSLCPDLFRRMCKRHPGLKSFNVLDSTDPAAIGIVRMKIEPKKTLFIVASKSGGTVETRSHEAYFLEMLTEAGIKNAGHHFVAITDAGSQLQKFAQQQKYRQVFLNPSDIGGRYSALSYFGLVPGFFAGIDIRALVADALMMQKLVTERSDDTNPALLLGSFMAAAVRQGRDKLTFIATKRTAALVPWIEQLVAESTGKNKLGVVPIDAEPSGCLDQYKSDRSLVFLRMANERPAAADRLAREAAAKHVPMVELTLGSVAELGRQFLLWEAATAVAGCLLKINPFDEPNVTESKNNTTALLAAFERSGQFPDQVAHSRWGSLSLVAYGGPRPLRAADTKTLAACLKSFMKTARPPQYLSLLSYFKSDRRSEIVLEKIRSEVRNKTGLATTRGYGPRYLHSIGQLFKGGPPTGLYIVFVRARYPRLPIPEQIFDFGQLIAAQAIGDSQALIKRQRPTLVIAIDGNVADGLKRFSTALRQALK